MFDLLVRCLGSVPGVLLATPCLLLAQTPPPPVPVPTPAPAGGQQDPAPAPTPPAPTPSAPDTTQEPAPVQPPQGEAQGAERPERPGRFRRRGEGGEGERRGQGGPGGGQGGGPGQELTELPEFVPVAAPPLAGLEGKQSFWFTMYPNFLAQFDPATDTLVRKGELKRGMFWSTRLTHDRKRMLVVTDQQQSIEVVDLATGTVQSEHPFREEGMTLRIREVRECPGGVHWLVQTERVKKEVDRYSFEAAQWLLYDSSTQKVVRKVRRLPEVLQRGASLSADGTTWQQQDDEGNLRFLDGRTFEELGKIDLRTPRYFGAGAIRLSGTDLLDRRDPTRALMLFTTTDPVETRRSSWGLCELDLKERRVVAVQEWGPQQSTWGLRIAHRKRIGAAMSGGFGRDDDRSQLFLFDLTTGKKVCEAIEEFRPRRSLVAISPDADKVYIGVAGSDFEVFDGQLKRLKTVELDGEIVGTIHVVDG